MLSSEKIYEIAYKQSALDLNCEPGDFVKTENVITDLTIAPGARVCYNEPLPFTMVSYGRNIVAASKPEYKGIVSGYISRREFFRCFETPAVHALDAALEPLGVKSCFMAEFFLPDPARLARLSCGLELRVLTHEDFAPLYKPEWSNALCAERSVLDVLGVGAYDGGRLIGLAACSMDCADMWQIGVDVLPTYRGRGIACSTVSNLAAEILEKGKVPYYCRAWSNVPSGRTAIKSGFLPAWTELTAKPAGIVNESASPSHD